MRVHLEQPGDGKPVTGIDDLGLRWNNVVAFGAYPADAPVLEKQRGCRSEATRGEIKHAHPPHQDRPRRGATQCQPVWDLFRLTPRERVSPDAGAGGIECR